MRRVKVALTERQVRLLDRLAVQWQTTRAEVVRVLLDRALGKENRALAADLAAIDASFGVWDAESESDGWGRGDGERAVLLDRMWGR
ncbi:MAG TPA: hypothetical protein PLX71_09780 [Phycicoccus sp.]|nr:hypothetical protein [Phycicoccus sp.]